VFRLGLQISDDFAGSDDYQLNVEARVTGLNDKGAEWRTLLGMGRVATVGTDLYVPFSRQGSWFVSPEISYTALNQPLIVDNNVVAEYRVGTWFGALRVGHDFHDRLRLTAGLVRGRDIAKREIAAVIFPEKLRADVGGVNGTVLWDSLDNVRFPTRGVRAELGYTSYLTQLDSDSAGNLWRATVDSAWTQGRNTVLLGARASLSKDSVDSFQTQSSLGGLTFLSGLSERELLGEQMLLIRSIYYRRVTERSLLLDMPLYLAASIEGGNVWADYDDVSFGDLIGAGSVFLGIDLPIGPLQLGYGRTFDGRSAVYLTFGSLVLPRYR
jgi:NTE family protein